MQKSINLTVTAKDTGDRLSAKSPILFEENRATSDPSIIVDDRVRYQQVVGFGGAFTEAASSTLQKMPPAKQEEMLRAYFDRETGHGYSLCRTHINSCDFSLGNYAYTEVEGDVDFAHFTIERDRKSLIPMIRRAFEMSSGDINLLASPWSPPWWMKTTGQMNEGGKLKEEYRAAWARYYARYIREYAKEDIPIWGVSIQNEPDAVQPWDSCIYSAEDERVFVRDYLGPVLHDDGLDDVKIVIWDHNRDQLFARAKGVLDDPAAAKYVWGVGFHWYGDDKFDNVQRVHDAFPDKPLLLTEACVEAGPHTGEWGLGERYARSIVQDLNHHAVGWIDWNMILDERGGPNHVGNLCSSPIIADTQTGEILYQSSYFYLGHFARFIRPGAQRVLCATSRDGLEATAALNEDGTFAVVVLNRTDAAIDFQLKHGGYSARVSCPAHGIITATWK